eukprot:gnl/MRDRNA2_/MRDRNA2_36375_c0_seq1.p1 gnl/MRDRNA2_/MRDRNA2_36375_c0~~gnl/MRDRNA2_/MRDRNA2_36375_c0_seq1.p1  ORF type:complete len:414 (-),score=110.99 gnl/MRDRNA2_/MRDRNA2_36375_c0_seq1:72-1313(-)
MGGYLRIIWILLIQCGTGIVAQMLKESREFKRRYPERAGEKGRNPKVTSVGGEDGGFFGRDSGSGDASDASDDDKGEERRSDKSRQFEEKHKGKKYAEIKQERRDSTWATRIRSAEKVGSSAKQMVTAWMEEAQKKEKRRKMKYKTRKEEFENAKEREKKERKEKGESVKMAHRRRGIDKRQEESGKKLKTTKADKFNKTRKESRSQDKKDRNATVVNTTRNTTRTKDRKQNRTQRRGEQNGTQRREKWRKAVKKKKDETKSHIAAVKARSGSDENGRRRRELKAAQKLQNQAKQALKAAKAAADATGANAEGIRNSKDELEKMKEDQDLMGGVADLRTVRKSLGLSEKDGAELPKQNEKARKHQRAACKSSAHAKLFTQASNLNVPSAALLIGLFLGGGVVFCKPQFHTMKR